MPKSQFVDPAKMREPGVLTFKDIPINAYSKTFEQERANFSDNDLIGIFKDMQYIANDPHPEWRAYAKAASGLLQKHPELLLKGDYRCDAALSAANPELHHGLFTGGGEQCIVLWNDNDTELPIHLAGHTASRWESVESSGEGVPSSIAPNALIVLF